MKPSISKIATSLAIALVAFGYASTALADTDQDFDTPGGTAFVGENYPNPTAQPPPAVIVSETFSTGQYLRLLGGSAFNSQNGVGFDLSDAGTYNHIIADFD
jgi:hypothetical protein